MTLHQEQADMLSHSELMVGRGWYQRTLWSRAQQRLGDSWEAVPKLLILTDAVAWHVFQSHVKVQWRG